MKLHTLTLSQCDFTLETQKKLFYNKTLQKLEKGREIEGSNKRQILFKTQREKWLFWSQYLNHWEWNKVTFWHFGHSEFDYVLL